MSFMNFTGSRAFLADAEIKDVIKASISMTNPLNTNVALLYDPAEWPGLEIG